MNGHKNERDENERIPRGSRQDNKKNKKNTKNTKNTKNKEQRTKGKNEKVCGVVWIRRWEKERGVRSGWLSGSKWPLFTLFVAPLRVAVDYQRTREEREKRKEEGGRRWSIFVVSLYHRFFL